MWTVRVVNNAGKTVVAPDPKTLYVEGELAAIFIEDMGSITLLDVGHRPGGPHHWAVKVTSGGVSQYWWYDGGGGQGVLTISADRTFQLNGIIPSTSLTGKIGGPFGVGATLPSNQLVYYRAVTNAAYLQRATMTVNGAPKSFCWTGSGENNAEMADISQATPVADGNVAVMTAMEHSTDNGATWKESVYAGVGTPSIMSYRANIIVSEDATDQDYNDCAITMQWWQRPPEHLRHLAVPGS